MKESSSPKRSKKSDNARKGTLVEAIVSMVHELPGVKVERNVLLPPVHGNPERRREIDVLLTGDVAGYPIRIAFSCKNERKKVTPGQIGEFIDELDDVGIPTQNGIFVCVNGYTQGALDRAREKGMRTLVLHGLTKDRLTSEVADAFQFNVSLLADVTSITVTNTVNTQEFEGQFFLFFDDSRNPCGTVLDLVLAWWKKTGPSISIGEHELILDVPEGWNQFVSGQPARVLAISATVSVRGLIVTLIGKLRKHVLINPIAQKVERSRIDVEFPIPRRGKTILPLKAANTEEDLEAFVRRRGTASVILRTKLPRLLYNSFYYPWSERVFRLMIERLTKFDAGEISDPRLLTLEEIEGLDLSTAWEPPWYVTSKTDSPPVIVPDDEGNQLDIRLLMKAGEYERVVSLREQFLKNPTPEFAHLLYWAFIMQAERLREKARVKESKNAQRLLAIAIEKLRTAIGLIPSRPDAYINLGAALHEIGRHSEAVSAYDDALAINDEDYQAWANKAGALISLEDFDSALAAIDKAVAFAPTDKDQLQPLSMRAYIHHRVGRDSEAADNLVAAWKKSAEELLADTEHHDLFESVCLRSQSVNTTLLLTELYATQAANEAKAKKRLEAKTMLDKALAMLKTLHSPRTSKTSLVMETVSGQFVYDALTRSATRMAQTNSPDLSVDFVRALQAWVVSVFGDEFDSLTELLNDLVADGK